MNNLAPLPHEWMLVSILGFFVSMWWVYDLSKTWGFTFIVFFILMFIASVISMSGAGTNPDELKELAIHEKHVRSGKHRKKKK